MKHGANYETKSDTPALDSVDDNRTSLVLENRAPCQSQAYRNDVI